MTDKHEKLNSFLVDVFNEILRVEEKSLSRSEFNDISVREMHVIDAVCTAEISGENRAADIAAALDVTPGTLTTSTSLLERKGYLVRKKDETDRRVVRLTSTPKGKKANDLHAGFHREMVDEVLNLLNEDEQDVIVKALGGVATYFRAKQKENSKHG